MQKKIILFVKPKKTGRQKHSDGLNLFI